MSRRRELIDQLSAPGLTLAGTMGAVDALERELAEERVVNLGLSSNVSVDLLSLFLRKHACLSGVRAQVHIGQHDDPVGDAARFQAMGAYGMLLVQFFDNLLPAFEQRLALFEPEQLAAKEAELRARWRLCFEHARSLPFVYVTRFHRLGLATEACAPDAVDDTILRFNDALREEAAAYANVRLIEVGDIVAALGHGGAFDLRFYYRNTAPYTPAFMNGLAHRIAAASRGFGSEFRKVLVLDCDNTLWGGVVGEDMLGGIRLDPFGHPGRIYWAIQHEILALERQGVLLCLCSKNNAADVEEVLTQHPHAVLRPEHLTHSKIDWNDKVSNLLALSRELDLGLESFVFLDDSEFECAAVREALPMVKVYRVPSALHDYPRLLHEIKSLFLAGGVSAQSRSKTAQYRQLRQADAERSRFTSHEAYLASLQLRVRIACDDRRHIERISELTLKSNQFNLTTLRQSAGEIACRMDAEDDSVYSLSVEDRFGSAGLTGVLLVRWSGEVARIEAFLMSCRVIGRGVEFTPWARVVRDASARGCTRIEASFHATAKNAQVADFFDRLGLRRVEEANGTRRYRSALAGLTLPTIDWISIEHA